MQSESKRNAIIIIAFNNSKFIIAHLNCLKFFLKEDCDIIIFDNSNNHPVLNETTENLLADTPNLTYFKFIGNHNNPSDSHAIALNAAFKSYSHTHSKLLFLDHDCFPIKPFSIDEILSGKIMAGISQGRSERPYLWAGCLALDCEKIDNNLIDFSTNQKYRLDTGGNLYKLLKKYGIKNCHFLNEVRHKNEFFTDSEYDFYNTINNDMFMHFTNGSNWSGSVNHEERLTTLFNILHEKIRIASH